MAQWRQILMHAVKKIIAVVLYVILGMFCITHAFGEQSKATSTNVNYIWLNPFVFNYGDSSNNKIPTTISTNADYHKVLCSLEHSQDYFGDPMQLSKQGSKQYVSAHNCQELWDYWHKGYKITDQFYNDAYTGSPPFPDMLHLCKILNLMQKMKIAKFSALSDFKLNAANLKYLPVDIVPDFTLKYIETLSKQGVNLQDAMEMYPAKPMSDKVKLRFIDEIKYKLTDFPKEILSDEAIAAITTEINKREANNENLSDKELLQVYNKYAPKQSPLVKITEDRMFPVYSNDNTYNGIEIYFPGLEVLGFIVVARGDLMGDGHDSILLWRYLDITSGGGRGPSMGNNLFILGRNQKNDSLYLEWKQGNDRF